MAINIPRSPISQAATQRRSLLPASEAGQVARTFKYVADTALAVTTDYFDKKAKVDAENFSSNLKTFNEQQERSVQESARMIGMSEQEDPMGREAQLFDLGQTYIDNLKTFVDTEMEGMGPLAKKRLAPQMQKALTDLEKDPSGLMLDLTDSMEKGQIDSIKQRALGDYQEYPTPDLANQIIKDFNELQSFEDRGRISSEELNNLEKYTVNNITNAYGPGVTNQTQLAVDIMSGKFAELPKTMRTDLDSMLLNNLEDFVGSAQADVQNIEFGSFMGPVVPGMGTPTAGFIAYKVPDKSNSEEKISQFINGLMSLGYEAEANQLQISLIKGQAAQATQDQIGHAAARLQNFIMGGVDNPMLTPQMSTAISSLYAKNPEFLMGQQFTSEDLLRFDQAAGGLPGFVIDQINQRIKGHDMNMYEAMYQFMGAGNAFKAADSSSEEFQIKSEVLKRINEYRVLREGVDDPVAAFNALYSEEPKGSGGGGASGAGGVSGPDAVEKTEELLNVIGTDEKYGLHQQTYLLNTTASDRLSFMQTANNPFISLDQKTPIGAQLAYENAKANTEFAENGNILLNGRLDPAKTDPKGTLAWVQDEIIRQLDDNPSYIEGWVQMSKDAKKKYVSGAVLEKDDQGFYKLALDPEQTQETYPGFIPEFYLELDYKNSFTFALSKFEKQFGGVEIRNGEVFFGDKEFDDLSADQAQDVIVQMVTGGMGSTYFDPENVLGRAAETTGKAFAGTAMQLGTEVLEEIEYRAKWLGAFVLSRFADDSEKAFDQLAPKGFEESGPGQYYGPLFLQTVDRIPESTKTGNPVPPFMMVPRFRTMYAQEIAHATREMQNPGSYEITSGIALNPEFSYAFDRLKNVLSTAAAPGQENFLQLLGQEAGLLDDFQTVAMQVANERFQARLKQMIKDNPKVLNEFQVKPNVQSQFYEIFNTNYTVEDWARGQVSLVTEITDTQTIPEILMTSPAVRDVYGRVGEMTDDLVETGNTFLQMLTGRGSKGQKFRKALEDSAVGQLADLPVDFATAARESFDRVDFDSFWDDTMKVVKDVTVGYGELAGDTLKVLAYDMWKQIVEQSPQGELEPDPNTPLYKWTGEILGGAAEGAWATVRTLYYDAPKAMGEAFMRTEAGQQLKPVLEAGEEIIGGAAGLATETLKFPFSVIEDLSEATARRPGETSDMVKLGKALAESTPGQIVIDTSKGFVDLYSQTLQVPYMIMEQWPKAESPEKVTGAVEPLNPTPSLQSRFMGQLRMNVDVRMQNGVEISIPGQAQINQGMLRIVPDNPRHSDLINGQNVEVRINPITPMQDGLGQSVKFGADSLPSIPMTEGGKAFVPESLKSNVEQWKKDNAEFNIMPRKDGAYHPPGYDMDIRNVQRFVSSDQPKAIREISKMLYGSFDAEDKDFLFASGLIQKPKGARKGWYGKYYSKRSQEMLESFGQNPNSELKSMQTGLAQAMPGNSMVFVLGLTNQQFFSLVEDLYAQWESESK